MTSWLDELDAAAVHAMLGDAVAPYGGLRSVSVRPERIRALIACVRAADKVDLAIERNAEFEVIHHMAQKYRTARAALEATP